MLVEDPEPDEDDPEPDDDVPEPDGDEEDEEGELGDFDDAGLLLEDEPRLSLR